MSKEPTVNSYSVFGCLPLILAVWIIFNHDAVGAFLLRLVEGACR